MAGTSGDRDVNGKISADDTPEAVFLKVTDDIYCSLEKTKKLINNEKFKAACEAILHARRILVFGLGNSSSVATDAAHKLLRLGYDATAYTDNHMQVIASSHLDEHCVIIAITHSGSSKDIIDALKVAKTCKAVTVTITDANNPPSTSIRTIFWQRPRTKSITAFLASLPGLHSLPLWTPFIIM